MHAQLAEHSHWTHLYNSIEQWNREAAEGVGHKLNTNHLQLEDDRTKWVKYSIGGDDDAHPETMVDGLSYMHEGQSEAHSNLPSYQNCYTYYREA